MRVLVVEDYPPVRKAIVTALRENGYTVDETEDGNTGLEMATTREYDVVVLDLSMPDIDGQETFERIRQISSTTPVILVSGYSEELVAERLTSEADGVDFLNKPFSADELVSRIRHSLG